MPLTFQPRHGPIFSMASSGDFLKSVFQLLYEGCRDGPLLIYGQFIKIIAASSLSSALRTPFLKAHQRLKRKGLVLTTIPGLICREETPTRSKSAFFYFKKFKNKEVKIRHDASSNHLSWHRNNYKTPYSGKKLGKLIEAFSEKNTFKNLLSKDGTPSIYQYLKTADLLVVSIARDINSKQNKKNNQELKNIDHFINLLPLN